MIRCLIPLILLALPRLAAADGPSEADRAAVLLAGSFSSAAQAARDSAYFDIRLETVPIWRGRSDGPWLYVEQAAAGARERPYRQRIYRLVVTGPRSVRSDVYTLPDPLRFAGAWRRPARFGSLTPDSLALREGCSVHLERTSDGGYRGSTRGTACASELRGARYATSEVRLAPAGVTSWDRGYDSAGNQVWGAKTGPYMFRRIAR